MAHQQKREKESGGVNINSESVSVGGDIVGRDKTIIESGLSRSDLNWITSEFEKIKRTIDKRPTDESVDKSEIKQAVEQLEQEVKKGEAAQPAKVERWLRFLGAMADDIFDVTVATLANPVAGIGAAVKLIAQKVKEENEKKDAQDLHTR